MPSSPIVNSVFSPLLFLILHSVLLPLLFPFFIPLSVHIKHWLCSWQFIPPNTPLLHFFSPYLNSLHPLDWRWICSLSLLTSSFPSSLPLTVLVCIPVRLPSIFLFFSSMLNSLHPSLTNYLRGSFPLLQTTSPLHPMWASQQKRLDFTAPTSFLSFSFSLFIILFLMTMYLLSFHLLHMCCQISRIMPTSNFRFSNGPNKSISFFANPKSDMISQLSMSPHECLAYLPSILHRLFKHTARNSMLLTAIYPSIHSPTYKVFSLFHHLYFISKCESIIIGCDSCEC